MLSNSDVSDSAILWSVAQLHPWDFLGKNTGVSCHFLLQGIFLTQGIELASPASPSLVGRFFTTEPSAEIKVK